MAICNALFVYLNYLNVSWSYVNTKTFKRFKWYAGQKIANTCMTRCFCPKHQQRPSSQPPFLQGLRRGCALRIRMLQRINDSHTRPCVTCIIICMCACIWTHFAMTRHLSDARSTFHHLYCQHDIIENMSSYHDRLVCGCNGSRIEERIPLLWKSSFNVIRRAWIGFELAFNVSLFANICTRLSQSCLSVTLTISWRWTTPRSRSIPTSASTTTTWRRCWRSRCTKAFGTNRPPADLPWMTSFKPGWTTQVNDTSSKCQISFVSTGAWVQGDQMSKDLFCC